ncbi:hypothetical protein BCR39DRAFT_537064 [Naematelia encephala]|uniref:Rhodanese domain-containing protein n=1 Tax=Naematelia encephala TaxID=71784 RepID=A0A1Y2AZU9_9TREE|nr:hypothetical protein BCR39DRAFT_537064 [Naematelia encephala]
MSSAGPSSGADSSTDDERPLTLEEYERYGRQMIMPDFGLPGQARLKRARVAVVGAGGLGCPVLQYLAGAGVGTIGIFDHDHVSLSNLHRQVLHTTERVGMNKARSAQLAINALNPNINALAISEAILPSTAEELLTNYDILVDCTDRPLTRYLLSDLSVKLGIPLVSGAAISSAGQWAVYGGDVKGKRRACYRCLWPKVVHGSGSEGVCEEVGVWGVVVGMVGVGMAGEVIKLIIGKEDEQPLLQLLHLGGNPLVRTVRMRGPRKDCVACGEAAVLPAKLEEMGYDEFCAGPASSVAIDQAAVERMRARDLADILKTSDTPRPLIIDTRPQVEYGICSLPGTTNIPFDTILSSLDAVPPSTDVVFLCRKGNDSQVAAQALAKTSPSTRVRDVRGGLVAYSREVDPTFPIY